MDKTYQKKKKLVQVIGSVNSVKPSGLKLKDAETGELRWLFFSKYKKDALQPIIGSLLVGGNVKLYVNEHQYPNGDISFFIEDIEMLSDSAMEDEQALLSGSDELYSQDSLDAAGQGITDELDGSLADDAFVDDSLGGLEDAEGSLGDGLGDDFGDGIDDGLQGLGDDLAGDLGDQQSGFESMEEDELGSLGSLGSPEAPQPPRRAPVAAPAQSGFSVSDLSPEAVMIIRQVETLAREIRGLRSSVDDIRRRIDSVTEEGGGGSINEVKLKVLAVASQMLTEVYNSGVSEMLDKGIINHEKDFTRVIKATYTEVMKETSSLVKLLMEDVLSLPGRIAELERKGSDIADYSGPSGG